MALRRPRVLVTRSPHQSSELAEALRALDIEPVLIPAIKLTDPGSFTALDAALTHLDCFHWLIFTSANAVEAFHRRATRSPVILSEARSEDRAKSKGHCISSALTGTQASEQEAGPSLVSGVPHIPRIAAIGPSTARAVTAIGLAVDLVPPQAVAESFAEALLPHVRQPNRSATRFLLVRAEAVGDTPPREHLPETLRAAGAEVTLAPAYRTVVPEESIPAIRALFTRSNERRLQARQPALSEVEWVSQGHGIGPPQSPLDAITFTSSSSVHNLLALCEAADVTLPAAPLRVSIGPITSQTLRDAGYFPHAEAPETTVASLAEAVVRALDSRLPGPSS